MDQKIEQHSRLGLQIEFAFLRGGLECRIIPLGPINVAAISTEEFSNGLSSGQNVRMH
jgi:hypothetical protein